MTREGRSIWMRRALVIVVAVAVTVTAVPVFWLGGEVSAVDQNRIEFRNIDSHFVLPIGKKHKIRCVGFNRAAGKKIRYSTSKKRVATISRRGVIKAKRNGVVTLTAYVKVKGKKKYKNSVKIRVGTRVSTINVKGDQWIRAGQTVALKATASPISAKDRTVRWTTSDSGIARVSAGGVVTGVREGSVTITAMARDGSGVTCKFPMRVCRFPKCGVKWVAHRGLHTSATENTRQAFTAAGQAGFSWCECDIWPTKADENGEYEFVINHDQTFKRLFGVDAAASEMTAAQIRGDDRLEGVCFLDEYLRICWTYGMIPIIEMKGSATKDNIEKMVSVVDGVDQEEGSDYLQEAIWISFCFDNLVWMKEHLQQCNVQKPNIVYLMDIRSEEGALDNARKAKDGGFTGVSVYWEGVFSDLDQYCRTNGLTLDLWTFPDNATGRKGLYQIMMQSGYQIYHYTVDYMPWT